MPWQFLVLTAVITVGMPLQGQQSSSDRWFQSLAPLQSRARQASPEIRAAKEAVQAAKGRERQAMAWPNPLLTFSREQTSGGNEKNSQNILSLEQTLAIGGLRGAERRVASYEREAAEARLSLAEREVDYQVTRALASVAVTTHRASLARAAAQAFKDALERSAAQLAAGDISRYQHLRLQLEAARYQALRVAAVVARDSAITALGVLLGDAQPVDTMVADGVAPLPSPAPLTLTVDSLIAVTLVSHPELMALGREAQAAASEGRVARAERFPAPLVVGGYKSERLSTGETLHGFVASVGFRLPLWDRRSGAIQTASARSRAKEAELAMTRRNLAREIKTTFARHQAVATLLRDLESQLGDTAAKARHAAQIAYAEGEITLLEWLDAVRAYHEAESSYADLWLEYLTLRAALGRFTGLALL